MSGENDFCASPRRVLLLERDFALVRHATLALKPHLVTSVPTIAQAQDILERYEFDVIVFDPHEPGGLDLLVELSRELPLVRRVVYTRDAASRHAFGLAHATVQKPADGSTVREAVLGAVDQREFRSTRR
jgi:DNA-binding NtrC family response regulator